MVITVITVIPPFVGASGLVSCIGRVNCEKLTTLDEALESLDSGGYADAVKSM